MCIIYFSTHTGCTHSHLLGAWNCGLNCANDARHTFYVENNGFDCSTCVFLRGEELDPDVNPLQYYAPLFGGEMTRHGQEENKMGHDEQEEYSERGYEDETASHPERVYKALSDPDSLSSAWRASPPAPHHFAYSPTPPSAQHSKPYQHHVASQYPDSSLTIHLEPPITPHNIHALSPQMTPRTAAHRNLVTAQLRQLPQVQGPVVHPMNQCQMVQNPQGDYSLVPHWMANPGTQGWGTQ
jgi:hypothetical protein